MSREGVLPATLCLVVTCLLAAPAALAEPAAAPVCVMETRHEAGGPVLYTTSYFADHDGHLALEEVNTGGAVTMRTRFRRDDKGRVVESCFFNVDAQGKESADGCGKLSYRGAARQPSAETDVMADGKTAATWTYEYDRQGRESRRAGRRLPGKVALEQKRSYDAQGRIERTVMSEPHMKTIVDYHYSAAGELVEEILSGEDGRVDVVRSYTKPCPHGLLLDAS
jgi:hypothetical protein